MIEILIGVLVFAQFFCIYMLLRNEWVYNQRVKCSNDDTYDQLKYTYEEMLNRFWIWDINKFKEPKE